MTRRKRAARGRSSIHPDPQGGWSGWVSLGSDPLTGKRIRRHVRGATEDDVVAKVEHLEAQRRKRGTRFTADTTVEQWLTHWLLICECTLKPKTVEIYASHVTNHLIPQMGDIRLCDLRPEHIEIALGRLTYHREPHLGESATAVTKNSVLRAVSAALTVAADRDLIPADPAKRVKPFNEADKEVEPLTRDEIAAILKVIGGRRKGARWHLALMLGLRQGEVLGLKWSDIDIDKSCLTVSRAIQATRWRHGCPAPDLCGRPNGCPQRYRPSKVTTPKSTKGRRTLILGEQMLATLQQHRKDQVAERLRAGDVWQDEDWVFPTTVGTSISPRNDYREWQHILNQAGVRHARIHDARHTNATALLAGGVDQRTVMELMGWSQVSMTQRYQHVVSDLKRDAAQRVEDYILDPSNRHSTGDWA